MLNGTQSTNPKMIHFLGNHKLALSNFYSPNGGTKRLSKITEQSNDLLHTNDKTLRRSSSVMNGGGIGEF